ncbi:hypothetical protein GGS20DRAFT_590411 [Poronia punctata]|nr:hypothetical protein GGS20DRAFT_590411 [Poronia punctata]
MEQQDIPLLSNFVRSRIVPLNTIREAAALFVLYPLRRSKRGDVAETSTEQVKKQVAAHLDLNLDAPVKVKTQAVTQNVQPSGVKWRYAEQGSKLHRTAFLEENDAEFSRKSYIDGLTYMLMGLPDNLSDKERAAIRDALPPSIAIRTAQTTERVAIPSNHLQRCIASIVAFSVLLLYWASLAIRVAVRYDRDHNVSQRLVSKGFCIVSSAGKHGVDLSAKICAISDGRVGKAISSFAAWTVESVTCGIQDGLGQGLTMVDSRPQQANMSRAPAYLAENRVVLSG